MHLLTREVLVIPVVDEVHYASGCQPLVSVLFVAVLIALFLLKNFFITCIYMVHPNDVQPVCVNCENVIYLCTFVV